MMTIEELEIKFPDDHEKIWAKFMEAAEMLEPFEIAEILLDRQTEEQVRKDLEWEKKHDT